jgi:hypothetical protein
VPQYSYAWLLYVVAAVVALGMAYAIFQLHYAYGQAPHRIIKILVGVTIFTVAFFRPHVALHAWLLALPLGEYLPATGIPGINAPNLIFIILLVSWIVPRIFARQQIFVRARLTVPIALFIGVLFMSLLKVVVFPPSTGSYPAMVLVKNLWNSVLGIAVYFVVVNTVENREQMKNLLVTFGVGLTVGALIALDQYGGLASHQRVSGALGDVNDLGAYFAMCATMIIGIVLVSSRIFPMMKRLTIWVSSAFAAIGVFLPNSRGALVGFACGLGLLTLSVSKRVFVLFLIVLALSPIWAPDFVKDRVAETRVDTVEAELMGDPTDKLDPSAGVRLKIWGIVFRETMRSSPIWGMGYSTIPFLTYKEIGRSFSSHNLYVAIFGEAGLIGIVALAWLLVSCVKSGIELLRAASRRLDRGIALGFLSATAALLAANVFGERFLNMSIAGTYFFLAGLVDRCVRFAATDKAPRTAEEMTS